MTLLAFALIVLALSFAIYLFDNRFQSIAISHLLASSMVTLHQLPPTARLQRKPIIVPSAEPRTIFPYPRVFVQLIDKVAPRDAFLSADSIMV